MRDILGFVRLSAPLVLCAALATAQERPHLIVDVPAEMRAAEQSRVAVRLSSPAAYEMSGRIVLSAMDNRAALFSTGGREAQFRIAANQTEATFDDAELFVQSGAGSPEISLRASLDGGDREVHAVIRVHAIAPVLNASGVRIRSVNGQRITLDTREFEVLIPGVAPSRDVQRAEFRFRPARAGGLQTTDINVDVSEQFRAFFAANPGRTDFTLVMPFTVAGSLLDIGGASVTLVNAAGERSNEISADSDIVPQQ